MPRPFATAKYSHIQYFMFMFILVVANALKLQTRFKACFVLLCVCLGSI